MASGVLGSPSASRTATRQPSWAAALGHHKAVSAVVAADDQQPPRGARPRPGLFRRHARRFPSFANRGKPWALPHARSPSSAQRSMASASLILCLPLSRYDICNQLCLQIIAAPLPRFRHQKRVMTRPAPRQQLCPSVNASGISGRAAAGCRPRDGTG